MRLSGNIDQVLKGVCFVGVKNDRGDFGPLGTAFFVSTTHGGHQFYTMVTARHVIEMISGDVVHLRVNLKAGKTKVLDSPKKAWVFHPNVPNGQFIDVAVCPFSKADEIKLLVMPLEEQMITPDDIGKANIGIGTETFMIGLFTNHYGVDRNFPVARFGAISMMLQEPMWTSYGFMDGYLVEAHSLGGSSGSPVFAAPELWQITPDGMPKLAGAKEWYFIGLISGHWAVENPEDIVSDDPEHRETARINTGMVIVTPVTKIIETINHPELFAQRERVIEKRKSEAKGKFVMDVTKPKPQDA